MQIVKPSRIEKEGLVLDLCGATAILSERLICLETMAASMIGGGITMFGFRVSDMVGHHAGRDVGGISRVLGATEAGIVAIERRVRKWTWGGDSEGSLTCSLVVLFHSPGLLFQSLVALSQSLVGLFQSLVALSHSLVGLPHSLGLFESQLLRSH